MSGLQVHMVPNNSILSEVELDKIILALQARVGHHLEEKIMHRKDVAAFLGIGTRQVDKLSNAGKLPYHRLDGLAAKLYLRSELIQLIKKS